MDIYNPIQKEQLFFFLCSYFNYMMLNNNKEQLAFKEGKNKPFSV